MHALAAVDFATGLKNLASFISAIVAGWGSILTVVLDEANWIMLLPVFTYIFVVVTSSLRSMYKG